MLVRLGQDMKWVYNDGGRSETGLQGSAYDCAARAVSIATQRPYYEIYSLINEVARETGRGSSSEDGVYNEGDLEEVMRRLGWNWVEAGWKGYLRSVALPSGRLVCYMKEHFTAVIDGIIHDTFDCSRNRCLYGYYVDPHSL